MAFKTALIGFGMTAAGHSADPLFDRWFPYGTHARALAAHSGFDCCAVVDPSPEARAAANALGIEAVVESIDQLDRDIEVAVIATPPQYRMPVIDALPRLRAVMVEKPLGNNIKDVTAFLDQCRGRDIQVQVNMWRRGNRYFRELSKGGLESLVGSVQAVFGTYGNGIHNNGIHLIDFVDLLIDEVVAAEACGSVQVLENPPITGDVNVPFVLHLRGGACVQVQPLDFRYYREVGLDVWGTKGRLCIAQESLVGQFYPRVDNRGLKNEREIAIDQPAEIKLDDPESHLQLYDNLYRFLTSDEPLWSTGENVYAAERHVDSIVRSA